MHPRRYTLPCLLVFAVSAHGFIDPITGVVRAGRSASGAPLGGIATGALYVQTDGALDAFRCKQQYTQLDASAWAVRVRANGETRTYLLQEESDEGFPGVELVAVRGEYPLLDLYYIDARLPVHLSARVLAPVVPLDQETSGLPVLLWQMNVENPLDTPIEIDLLLAWQNPSCPMLQRDRVGRMEYRESEALSGQIFRTVGAGMVEEFFVGTANDMGLDVSHATYRPREGLAPVLADFHRTGNVKDHAPGNAAPDEIMGSAVSIRMPIPANGRRNARIILAWYQVGDVTQRHPYTLPYRNAWEIATLAVEQQLPLTRESRRLGQLLERSNLSPAVRRLLLRAAQTVNTASLHTTHGGFSTMGDDLPLPLVEDGFTGLFFPQLAEQALVGGLRNTGRLMVSGEAADLVLRAYRTYRWTGDTAFLDRVYPLCRDACERLAGYDIDGDGIPDPLSGRLSRWVVAQRALEAMAWVRSDTQTARLAGERAARAQAHLDAHTDAEELHETLLSAWSAEQLGLRGPLSEENLVNILAMQAAENSPYQWAMPPCGLLRASPHFDSELSLLPYALLVDGALQMKFGDPTTGLLWLERIIEVAEQVNRSPFRLARTYDAFTGAALSEEDDAAAAAAWFVPHAIAGLTLDAPGRALTLAPRPTHGETYLSMPLFTPGWWAWLDWNEHVDGFHMALRMERPPQDGPLTLARLRTWNLPAPSAYKVFLNDASIHPRLEIGEAFVTLVFEPALQLSMGDILDVHAHGAPPSPPSE